MRAQSMRVVLFSCSILALAVCAMAQDKDKEHPVTKQSQTQNQTVTNGATSSSSSAGQTNSQVSDVRVPHQAPSVFVPDSFPTAPCRIAVSLGGSFVMGGGGLGMSKADDECNKRETARAFANLGFKEAALKILCTTKAARKALGEGCHKLKPEHEWTEQNSLTFPN